MNPRIVLDYEPGLDSFTVCDITLLYGVYTYSKCEYSKMKLVQPNGITKEFYPSDVDFFWTPQGYYVYGNTFQVPTPMSGLYEVQIAYAPRAEIGSAYVTDDVLVYDAGSGVNKFYKALSSFTLSVSPPSASQLQEITEDEMFNLTYGSVQFFNSLKIEKCLCEMNQELVCEITESPDSHISSFAGYKNWIEILSMYYSVYTAIVPKLEVSWTSFYVFSGRTYLITYFNSTKSRVEIISRYAEALASIGNFVNSVCGCCGC